MSNIAKFDAIRLYLRQQFPQYHVTDFREGTSRAQVFHVDGPPRRIAQAGQRPRSATINVHDLLLTHVRGAVGIASVRTEEPRAALATPLGNLVGALFHHRLGWFLLGRFLLCHALSH